MSERTGKADVKKVQFLLLGKGAAGRVGFWRFKRNVYRGSLLKVPDSPFSPGNLNFHINAAGFGTSSYQWFCSPQSVVPVIMWVSGLVHDGSELYHQGAGGTLFFGPVSNSNYVTVAQLLPLEVHSQTVSNSAVLNSPQMNKHRHHFLQIKHDWLKYT